MISNVIMFRFRFPDIQAKVVPLMKDYLTALRSKDDTPSPLLMTSRTSEEDVLDSFKAEVIAKQAGKLLFFLCTNLFLLFFHDNLICNFQRKSVNVRPKKPARRMSADVTTAERWKQRAARK